MNYIRIANGIFPSTSLFPIQVSVLLVPSGVGMVEDPLLIHVIVWSVIGGALILVILVIFLYAVSF